MLFEQVLLAAATLTIAAAVQSVLGFGAGIVAVPLLVMCGIPIHKAMVLVLPNNIVQTSINCWQHRTEWTHDSVILMLALRFAGLLGGIAVLATFIDDPTRARQATGVALLCVLATLRIFRVTPRATIAPFWTILSGLLSGFLAGGFMMGGPPLVLWVMAHDWSPNRQRAFLWGQFLLLMPLHTLVLTWQFGMEVWGALGWGCLLAPMGWVGAHIGNWLVERMSPVQLRHIMICTLVALGISAIVSPWMQDSASRHRSRASTPPRELEREVNDQPHK